MTPPHTNETRHAICASETISISKKDWDIHVQNAIALIQQNQHQQALAEMHKAERMAPNERDVQYWLANAYRMTGETDRALEIFEVLLAASVRAKDVDSQLAGDHKIIDQRWGAYYPPCYY